MTLDSTYPTLPPAGPVRSTAVKITFLSSAALSGIEALLYAVAIPLLSARQAQMASAIGSGNDIDPGPSGGLLFVSNGIQDCAILQLILYIGCVVAFLTWIFRAFKSMRMVRPNLIGTSNGYAVGGFFIPFVNLAHGYNMVKELWQASNPLVRDSDYYVPTPAPPLVSWWWGMFLLDGVLGWAMNLQKGQTIDDIKVAMAIGVLDSAITIAAAILAIKVVLRLTERINECTSLPDKPSTADTPGDL